jgi:hypothetical protein
MTLPPPLYRPPAKLRPEQAKPSPAQRIVVCPDQITQRDRRPWSQSSLEDVLIRFVLVSTVIVATGVGLLALGLGIILD